MISPSDGGIADAHTHVVRLEDIDGSIVALCSRAQRLDVRTNGQGKPRRARGRK